MNFVISIWSILIEKPPGLCLEQFNSFRTLLEQEMKFQTRHTVCMRALGNGDCWYLNMLVSPGRSEQFFTHASKGLLRSFFSPSPHSPREL